MFHQTPRPVTDSHTQSWSEPRVPHADTCSHTFGLRLHVLLGCTWCLSVKTKSQNTRRIVPNCSIPRRGVRTRPVRPGLALRCGSGAGTGLCQPGRSGSSPAAGLLGRPRPPDEPLPRGSPPPAAADWPPGERRGRSTSHRWLRRIHTGQSTVTLNHMS